MILDNQIIDHFQKKILDRYVLHARDLPWRKTTDPYKIWVSESMLCQTQVSRVIEYYHRWMELFPTVQSLATASNEDLLRARSGLGYNSRALRLKQAAIHIAAMEAFPSDYQSLIQLPWIGEYIANAVLAFAYNQDVVVIDTNIRRIMIHEFDLPHDVGKDLLRSIVLQTLPKGQSRIWYNALMDYGALELTAQKTGIKPLNKQSKFHGSTRQVRAGIVRSLLQSVWWCLSYADIAGLYTDREDLDEIITKMAKDGLILANGKVISIA